MYQLSIGPPVPSAHRFLHRPVVAPVVDHLLPRQAARSCQVVPGQRGVFLPMASWWIIINLQAVDHYTWKSNLEAGLGEGVLKSHSHGC